MAKTVYIYFAWQDKHQTLTMDDKQTFSKAMRSILPAGVRSDEIESAIDETGLNVIDQFGEHLHEGMKITVSRNKLYEGGAENPTGLVSSQYFGETSAKLLRNCDPGFTDLDTNTCDNHSTP